MADKSSKHHVNYKDALKDLLKICFKQHLHAVLEKIRSERIPDKKIKRIKKANLIKTVKIEKINILGYDGDITKNSLSKKKKRELRCILRELNIKYEKKDEQQELINRIINEAIRRIFKECYNNLSIGKRESIFKKLTVKPKGEEHLSWSGYVSKYNQQEIPDGEGTQKRKKKRTKKVKDIKEIKDMEAKLKYNSDLFLSLIHI